MTTGAGNLKKIIFKTAFGVIILAAIIVISIFLYDNEKAISNTHNSSPDKALSVDDK